MNEDIETRELITLEVLGAVVTGTYHKVPSGSAKSPSYSGQSKPVGVLFLNSLSPTRAAHGDSAVYWAESFAECGYPSFRLDMPGFGDSKGEPPPELIRFINTGGYAPLVAANAAALVDRFSLSGVVVVGLCGGAVSALFGAAACPQCRGLILMDPYFYLPHKGPSKLWQTLTGRVSRSAPGRFITATFDRMKDAWVSLLEDTLPNNANLPLLNCWKTLSADGLPILVFKAPGAKRSGGEFDYLGYLLRKAGRRSRVVIKEIDGAGHTFSSIAGRSGVRQNALRWLDASFPPIDSDIALVDSLPSPSYLLHGDNDCESHDRCVQA